MKLSTRLLLPLLATVAAVMLVYGAWALHQREVSHVEEAARETRAYALALGLAVERAIRHPEFGGVQEIIDRISREPTVYGVLVYDAAGQTQFRSDPVRAVPSAPPEVLARALATGELVAFGRVFDGSDVYSVVQPLRDDDGRVTGALEVAQPLTFLQAEMARTRHRYILNTVTLLAAVIVLVYWMVQRFVSRPLEQFSGAVRALGRGRLEHRLDVGAAGGELAEVASELNRMAAHLGAAQSDLVRESEERLALERRLRYSERLAAMGELAAGVAHEIAAPLHVIRGRADLLTRGEGSDGASSRNLAIIQRQIDRITLIVRNLTNFARRRDPRLLPTDVVVVLRGVLEFLEDEFDRNGVELIWRSPESLEVQGDPDLLHQVFLNVLINAIQALEATEAGQRRIEVDVELSEERERAGLFASIRIRDTGPGIPKEIAGHVFDPFFTTKTGSKGTGLGLAVARGILEDHEGSIEAVSHPEGGALFRLLLPTALASSTSERATVA